MSGFPGKSRQYRRNRNPIWCRQDLTTSSGAVFLLPTPLIIRLRFVFDTISTIVLMTISIIGENVKLLFVYV